jgi:TIR domain
MAAIFLSYSRDNEGLADVLAKDLMMLGHEVWFDRELSGQVWWNQILTRIRECNVFVFVLTPRSLGSVACRRECDYAAALRKPILPVCRTEWFSGIVLQVAVSGRDAR